MNLELLPDPELLPNALPPSWKSVIPLWFAEDTPSFDFGGYVVGSEPRTATLYMKSFGVLAGVPFVNEIMRYCCCNIEWHSREGLAIDEVDDQGRAAIATVTGPAKGLLLAERVALNVLARCSGIATATVDLRHALRRAGYKGILAGTRKTTPGFRLVEKYGMLVGGADTHRMDLSSMVMLKDNHIWAHGNITDAVSTARSAAGFSLKIDVEVGNEDDAEEAILAGADIVMLDNFTAEDVRTTSRRLKEKFTGQRNFMIEVSGGLRADNIAEYLCEDVDIISTSSIHQGVPHVDFSLKVE